MRALFEMGVDLNAANDKGERALTHAVQDGEFRLAIRMIEAGAACTYADTTPSVLVRYAGWNAPDERDTNSPKRTDYENLLKLLEEKEKEGNPR